jgi:tRNA nucleotidyltransferase/poly(A) polymerase
MPVTLPKARQFAVEVVQQLRDSGFEALWAGGCVRDQLLGRPPKDYDVATNATPDQIREVFGKRRTLPIGASFGVITVLGPKDAGQIEVATFRRDAEYSDGRHPDSVSFSNAEEDALRRDFTVNGLFFDPISEEVIDYVGGQEDLDQGLIRAIGNPHERFAEDRLRLLRAVRFAATLGFRIDPTTLEAIRTNADALDVVSAERIAGELRRMLVNPNRREAVELLQQTRLLNVILPEVASENESWPWTLDVLEELESPTFAAALAVLLRSIDQWSQKSDFVEVICRRWRLSNDEVSGVAFCLQHERIVLAAQETAWPELQRILIMPRSDGLLTYCAAIAKVEGSGADNVSFCQQKRDLPAEELNPRPLLNGDDLKATGIPPGLAYKSILHEVRDAQLLGSVTRQEEALELVMRLWETHKRS